MGRVGSACRHFVRYYRNPVFGAFFHALPENRLVRGRRTRLVQGSGEHAISAAQLSSRMTFVQVLVVCGASLPGLTRLPPTRPAETVRSSP
jgi:hypothetical protein